MDAGTITVGPEDIPRVPIVVDAPPPAADFPDVLSLVLDPAYMGLILVIWLVTEAVSKATKGWAYQKRLLPILPTVVAMGVVLPVKGVNGETVVLAVLLAAASAYVHDLGLKRLPGLGAKRPG